MSMPKSYKILQYLNWRVRITIQDSRYLIGTFMAFDKHLNVVLADCEEFRVIVPKSKGKDGKKQKIRTEQRVLGFVLLRGENVVSITPETPPPPKPKTHGHGIGVPVGTSAPSGRGLPPMPFPGAFPSQGMGSPAPGIGGPPSHQMMPSGRGMMPPGMGGSFPNSTGPYGSSRASHS